MKHIIVYKMYVTVKIIKSKLSDSRHSERKEGFSCTCISTKFFECAEVARWQCCSADNFKNQDYFRLLNYVNTHMYIYSGYAT